MFKKLLARAFATFDYSHRQYAKHPSLVPLGITNTNVLRNLSPPELYEHALNPEYENTNDSTVRRTMVSSTGALCAYSGEVTNRLPSEKRIVLDDITKSTVNWGKVNIPLPPSSYKANWARASDFLNTLKTLYLVDGYLGWDVKSRMKIRIICSLPYHALFMTNMLIPPSTDAELTEFDKGADFTILDAGNFKADPGVVGVGQKASVAINFNELLDATERELEYALECKRRC